MNTKQLKSTIYCPPEAEVLVVTAEGILCASNESYLLYDGNDLENFWED